jgi:ankyrin repeat protein
MHTSNNRSFRRFGTVLFGILVIVVLLVGCQKSQSEVFEANDAEALRDLISGQDAQWDSDWAGQAIQEDKSELVDVWMERFSEHMGQLDKDVLLHTAVEYRAPDSLTVLIKHGADPNGLYYNFTPLGQALDMSAFGGDKPALPVVKVLIEAGARINDQGRYRRPFVEAAGYADKETVAYLIEQGAFVNSGFLLGNSSPLQNAVMFNKPDVVELLLKNGAELSHNLYYGATITDNLDVLRLLAEADEHSEMGLSISLELTAGSDDADPALVSLLLELGADPNKSDTDLVAVYVKEKDKECVDILLRSGSRLTNASIAACLQSNDKELLSRFLKLEPSLQDFSKFLDNLLKGDADLVKAHVKTKPALLSSQIGSDTLVEWCVRQGEVEAVNILLTLNAKSSWEAVSLSLEQNHEPTVLASLLSSLDWADDSYYARSSIRQLKGQFPQLLPKKLATSLQDEAPLTELVENGQFEPLRARLLSGADPNERQKTGARPTLLHLAVQSDKEPLVELLLEHKADVLAQDLFGLTPIYYANLQSPMVQVLLEKGSSKEDFELARLMKSIENQESYTPNPETPLSKLALRTTDTDDGTFEMLVALLGPDAVELREDVPPGAGKTPLATAFEYGAAEIAVQLLEAGANPGDALQEALQYGDPKLVELCVQKGALSDDRALIELSEHYGFRPDLADKALKAGVDPNKPSAVGKRALVEAAGNNELMALWLLDHKADPSLPDSEKKYPLQESLHGHRFDQLANRLIEEGAPLDTRDKWDKTPLQWASDLPSRSLLEKMLAKGGKPDHDLRVQILANPYLKGVLSN